MTRTDLLTKIKNAPHVDFGNLFGESINLFQKVFLQGLLLQILTVAISYGISMLVMLPFSLGGAFIDYNDINSYSDEEVGIVAIITMFFLYLIITVVMAVVNFALQAAFYRIVRMKDRNKRSELGVGFGMFIKKQHIKKVLILSMAQIGIAVIAMLFFIIPLFFVLVPLQFAVIIFAFNPELSVNDILKAAFTLGTKKWGITFGACLIIGFLALVVGVMACFVGVYATISIVYLPAYLVYKEVVGFTEDEDLIAQIGV
ncbi:hypothetical protein [uncultured Dokdonia sp.]|uniref:hypothetical protein n=1 Tax=uncultured Dokdonia sp. TaxID=575653 RepID=UPI0026276F10|nr:hypothetical protein [uncultured Dokdonia sp.]